MLHAEPTGDGDSVRISLDIILKKNIESTDLVSQLNKLDYISDIVLIASKNDVDY